MTAAQEALEHCRILACQIGSLWFPVEWNQDPDLLVSNWKVLSIKISSWDKGKICGICIKAMEPKSF
jgi:hypothetical protein